MALDLESFIPMLTGGGGGMLVASLSKVFMSREKRAEKNEDAQRQERQMLMTTIMTQAENQGYMKSEIDKLKNELGDVKRREGDCQDAMRELRKELGLDRESTRPPA